MPLEGIWAEVWKKPVTEVIDTRKKIKGKGLGTQLQKRRH